MATNTSQYPELLKVLKLIGKESAITYKKNLKEKKKIASGKLYNSINYRLEITDTGVKLYFVAEKYYINIENGRKPNSKMPPIEVIQRWMKIKNIAYDKNDLITFKNGYKIPRATLYIAKKIGSKGIKPSPFLRDIKKGLSSWTNDIKAAVAKDLDIKVKEIKNSLKYIKGNSHIQFRTK